jgi:hypothetical protein
MLCMIPTLRTYAKPLTNAMVEPRQPNRHHLLFGHRAPASGALTSLLSARPSLMCDEMEELAGIEAQMRALSAQFRELEARLTALSATAWPGTRRRRSRHRGRRGNFLGRPATLQRVSRSAAITWWPARRAT